MEVEKFEKLPSEVRADMLKGQESIFFNAALFEQAQRVAQMFAQSTMVPKHFQGNVGNCMIGLNYAARIGADPFMVLQNLYVVHGRPGIEAKLVEAGINQSGKYSEPLQYEWLDPDDNDTTRNNVLKAKDGEWGCQAFTVDKVSGKRVTGPKIHWNLIKGMGWYDKKGPDGNVKSNFWRNMPEIMFYYRAASWFANKNCPEVKLGMQTKEELDDSVIDITPEREPLNIPDPDNLTSLIKGDDESNAEEPDTDQTSGQTEPENKGGESQDGGREIRDGQKAVSDPSQATPPPPTREKQNKINKSQDPKKFRNWVIRNWREAVDVATPIYQWLPVRIQEVQEKWNRLKLSVDGFPTDYTEPKGDEEIEQEIEQGEEKDEQPQDADTQIFVGQALDFYEELAESGEWDRILKAFNVENPKDVETHMRAAFLQTCNARLDKLNSSKGEVV